MLFSLRMSQEEAVEALCALSGLSQDLPGADEVSRKLERIPLALACAGHYIRTKTKQDPGYSFLDYSLELSSTLEKIPNTCNLTDETEKVTYAAIALETRTLIENTPHFLHIFDLIGTCSSDWPIPVSLVSLHLRSPDFNLPPIVGSGPALPSRIQDEPKPKQEAEEEVAEMFLSIKRMAKNLENFTTAVKANVEAIKEMLNPKPMDLPVPVDGVLELMRACPLVSTMKVDPGGWQFLYNLLLTQETFWFAWLHPFALRPQCPIRLQP